LLAVSECEHASNRVRRKKKRGEEVHQGPSAANIHRSDLVITSVR
jgi:hypothetical protein